MNGLGHQRTNRLVFSAEQPPILTEEAAAVLAQIVRTILEAAARERQRRSDLWRELIAPKHGKIVTGYHDIATMRGSG